jgi:uncharacterized OB-fold protein
MQQPMNTSQTISEKPRPRPDEASAPFWHAAANRRLEFPFCTTCGRWFHPANATCRLGHATVEFRPLSGRGTLNTFTVVRERAVRGCDPPYIVGLIELAEQERLFILTNIVEAGADELSIGMPVEVTFEDLGDNAVLPQFRPSER